MAAQDALDMVVERIATAVRRFDDKKNYYRRWSLVQTVLAATLGALTTLLIGLDQIYHQSFISALALTMGGLSTIAAAWNGWFRFKDLWLNDQNTVNDLHALRDRIDLRSTLVDAPPTGEEIEKYWSDYQAVIDGANREWTRARSQAGA